jgi:hypothetical protein
MNTEWTPIQKLQQQEKDLFIHRDEAEGEIERVLGKALTPLELLRIRQAVGEFEQCEERIGKVQERIKDLREWASE